MKLKNIKEKRYFTLAGKNLNVRAESNEAGERRIKGYGAVFNQESKLIVEWRNGEFVEFTEVIAEGAFDEVLADTERLNCVMTFNHDRSKTLARNKSGTLALSVDDTGLQYDFSVPNTPDGNTVYEMVARGDYYESSFVFTVDDEGEKWEKNGDKLKRTILKIKDLYDCAVCVDGAYANTTVSISRNLSDLLTPPTVDAAPVVEAVQPELVDESYTIEAEIFLLENL